MPAVPAAQPGQRLRGGAEHLHGGDQVGQIGDIRLFGSGPGREYAAVTAPDGSRSVCTATGTGGNIHLTCDAPVSGILTVEENYWPGWSARPPCAGWSVAAAPDATRRGASGAGVIGSVEYAAEHLGTPLVIVLGHEGCGAVKSTLEGAGEDGNLGSLVKDIRPAVASACQPATQGCDAVHQGVHLNARAQAQNLLARSPALKGLVAEGKVRVVVATYDLASGKVALEN